MSTILAKRTAPRFSTQTIQFMEKASRQKKESWLEENHEAFLNCVRLPLQNLAAELSKKLKPLAPGYHFPLKGLGRIKRSTVRAKEYGSLYKNYVSFTATRPSKSRFDHNPSLFFMINAADKEGDEVLLAGGLYMPSSRQLKIIREKIAENSEPFEKLFRSKAFASSFPDGFSKERTAIRPPRGFDPNHLKISWLKLQGFFVWRSYKKKDYTSKDFPELVARDGQQILRLNELLEQAISNHWPEADSKQPSTTSKRNYILERLGEAKVELHTPDF